MPHASIVLIPSLYAGDFPLDVADEFQNAELPVHGDSEVFQITWGSSRMPETQAWLAYWYGEGIKAYNTFAVQGT